MKQLIWRKPMDKKTVYLTFDDGPIPEVTPWVLDLLEQEGIKGTFFCIGDNVRKHPDVYRSISHKGHRIGQHTYNHLPAFKNSHSDYKENIELAKRWIASDLFRPPHGQIFYSQLFSISKEYKIVLWDVLSGDFDQTIKPEKCLENVIRYARNGSVIVFHDSLKAEKNLKYILPKVIHHLKKEGYEFGLL